MAGIEFDKTTMTGFLPASKTVVAIKGPATPAKLQPAVQPTNPAAPFDFTPGLKWAYWGPNNDLPQDVINLVSKNTVAPKALLFKIKSIYGRGIIPCYVEVDGNGSEKVTIADDPEINTFFKRNNIRKFMLELITDYVWFANAFPEVILNKSRDKIVEVYSNEATYCRWEKIDPKTRKIQNCYVSANWPWPFDYQYVKVPALDPYDPVNDIRNGSAYKYIMNVSMPSPGKSYYQIPAWDGARTSGWLDVANEIPRFKKAMFNKQMSLKYHVEIPYDHWEKKWTAMKNKPTEEEKIKIIVDELKKMDDLLAGAENAGKAFFSHYGVDAVSKKEIPGWKITPIDDVFKDGKWLPDSAAANSEILFAIGVDPSIMGAGMPGGGAYTGGSGSDKRESRKLKQANLYRERNVTLQLLNLISFLNGWDPEVYPKYLDTDTSQTMDQNPTGKQNVLQ